MAGEIKTGREPKFLYEICLDSGNILKKQPALFRTRKLNAAPIPNRVRTSMAPGRAYIMSSIVLPS